MKIADKEQTHHKVFARPFESRAAPARASDARRRRAGGAPEARGPRRGGGRRSRAALVPWATVPALRSSVAEAAACEDPRGAPSRRARRGASEARRQARGPHKRAGRRRLAGAAFALAPRWPGAALCSARLLPGAPPTGEARAGPTEALLAHAPPRSSALVSARARACQPPGCPCRTLWEGAGLRRRSSLQAG